ncbi:hypothetical protein KSP35_07015 [Aquihabitans sp. G128]|uniref:hypothetical protein n=1 Tax=Aquihabitans sp. G128 TaxID=2849779 RepID=UPI001C228411|nr:hypothetical protein [Aquihabitans sp. G128]QXC62542.1 hypothetical protein KSP35_07015 [Aquihabitans sp. G128]
MVHHVLVHVVSRARSQADGHIGLTPTPGGLGTPAFGPGPSIVRLTPTHLVVEGTEPTRTQPLAGATLRSLAEAAGADLDRELDVGGDTPPLGDVDAELVLDPGAIGRLAAWHALAWQVFDRVVAALPPDAEPARTQLWPEHLDSATNVVVGVDEAGQPRRVGLGASSGDGFHEAPYLYVGPWGPERPGDPAFWNAPFGAVCGYDDLRTAASPLDAATAFLTEGLDRLR